MTDKDYAQKPDREKMKVDLVRDVIRKFREFPGPGESRMADQVFPCCGINLVLALSLMPADGKKIMAVNLLAALTNLYALVCESHCRGEEADRKEYRRMKMEAERIIKKLGKIWPEILA